ncbi:DUF559 domain-containing protein [Xanthobacteraceae bacterium Astr-EGSB]|uniref:DUF559 domain-containing protein n=1 Tax=Astrobacterium formosum TaxID=3069710 RepID=UPI0027B6F935|nr:DUF559 domain-containing protein [Xanthobacteraceae bacterium Astr-EGSB]
MTPREVKLWVHLRSWRERGFHFRRQAPREGFIVDFVCVKQGLIGGRGRWRTAWI